MNRNQVVKLTNFLCIAGALLLVYWVFAFCLSTVFGFKVFQKNLTQLFGMSVLGIFAVIGCALILNIALNLSRIADSMAGQSEPNEKSILAKLSLLIIPFPLIFCLLYFGDLQTSHRKEAKLMQAAKHIIDDNKNSIDVLANYSFNSSFIKRSEEILRVISKEDENFPNISLIVSDTIDDKKVFLNFDSSNYIPENDEPRKSSFIYTSSKEERQYLQSVFSDGVTKTRFSASDGSYEMYVPVKRSNNTIVLYFSEYARYGKLGS